MSRQRGNGTYRTYRPYTTAGRFEDEHEHEDEDDDEDAVGGREGGV